MSIPAFFALVLGVGGLVLLIWWVLFKALLSNKTAHEGPVQNPDLNQPLRDRRPQQADHADHKFDDWQKALHESSAAGAEWADRTDIVQPDIQNETLGQNPTEESGG